MRRIPLALRIARVEKEIARLQAEDPDTLVAPGGLSVEEELERLYDELQDLEDNEDEDY